MTEKLSTIQKRANLNDVFVLGKKDERSGAYYRYAIAPHDFTPSGYSFEQIINFQNGARKEKMSVDGVLDTDLLEIVRHRLQCFQQGEFATRENACALTHIEEALMWMNKRVEDRIERGVLGTNNK